MSTSSAPAPSSAAAPPEAGSLREQLRRLGRRRRRSRSRPAPVPSRLVREARTGEGLLQLHEEGWGGYTILLVSGGRRQRLVECDVSMIAADYFDELVAMLA